MSTGLAETSCPEAESVNAWAVPSPERTTGGEVARTHGGVNTGPANVGGTVVAWPSTTHPRSRKAAKSRAENVTRTPVRIDGSSETGCPPTVIPSAQWPPSGASGTGPP